MTAMPFDASSPAVVATARDVRPVGYWLLGVCAMIWVMVALGGATRLTGSGLSIMEWAPIMGALPPMSEAEWNRLYRLYQQIPQYQLVNKGFGLEGFKEIFWLEWAHRLWGRLIGLAFLGPLLWFAWKGAIPRRLVPRMALLFVLGGMQGAVGWFMVASGFQPESTAVSPYRLVVHLMLALILYGAILWTALGLLRPVPLAAPPRARRWVATACALAASAILAGGFVAGNKAGLTYNTFPLMDGQLVPQGYALLEPFWRNLTENVASVQFNHRLLATLTALAGFAALAAGWASPARRLLLVLAGSLSLQYGLGVATLLHVVPVGLGTAHQAVAVLVLTAGLVCLHALRRPER